MSDEWKRIPFCRLRRHLDHPHRLFGDDRPPLLAPAAGDRRPEKSRCQVLRCQVSGPRSQALDFIAKFFLRPDTWNLRPFLCNHFALTRLLTMRPKLSAPLDSVSVECKSICLVQSQYSGDRYASAS